MLDTSEDTLTPVAVAAPRAPFVPPTPLNAEEDDGISPEDFEREKKRFVGAFIRGFNSLEYIAGHYTYYRFHGFDLFRGLEVLERLDRDLLVDRVRSLLDPDNVSAGLTTDNVGSDSQFQATFPYLGNPN